MIEIKIKPLSVNTAWQGKRFKTQAYKNYEIELFYLLKKIALPPPPYALFFEFGMSNKSMDIDNPIKPTTDILQKRYNFNDRDIYRLNVVKTIVKKGNEFIKFKIERYEN
ncbi:hypothetical protein DRO61_06230 [Candidatus Bathyarchaeota archaeon]|nr:MAG: hypothetical protein DRO61_06230 [Candidatus Bathyarchaeota archaeon]